MTHKKKVSVCVSFTCYKYIELEVENDYNESTLRDMADEETYADRQSLYNRDWEEDEFTVLEQ